ncbi:flagellar hook protein FlgE [Bordetella genomosp. 13]|uniref:Flagellar hook protein FlgE n=1 Tax=Bordetella genomosp. 13 TaxID=463040 RepID=A0A1W6ZAA1_9BORD|nr:flagellar hook protein FlgE [Bordetella genomosp. 13]ARP94316.1 flagellar biosynthesis protein FlgE [Bordetella genomosp. 13]
MGFGQGLSGLNAAAQNLDVIGNNIANSGTAGFKSGVVSFSDVYANSRVGLGVKVAAVNQRFTVGNVATTGGEYDIAIDGEKGFFRLADQSGGVFYSRNGEFLLDKDFFIVNQMGMRLTGYAAGAVGAAPVPLTVPQGNIAPVASTGVGVQTNLDANADPIDPATTPFDPTIRSTYTDQVPTTVYDSLGNAHEMQQYFVKREANAAGESVYDVYYTFDGNPMPVGAGGAAFATLRFDTSGVLLNTPPTVDVSFATPGGVNSPADPMAIALNYDGVTQFGNDFNPVLTPDGYASGQFLGIEIAADGSVMAQYSNGESQVVGVIALAKFNNVQGLQPVGNNAWQETAASGQAQLGQPGTNSLSTLSGQSLEQSNVNLSNELVNMIIAQRTYQANTQTIKTQDEVLQVLMNI